MTLLLLKGPPVPEGPSTFSGGMAVRAPRCWGAGL